MMANFWPNCNYFNINTTYFEFFNYFYYNISYCEVLSFKMLPFNKSRTKAIKRIGPHDKKILDIIICGMLGDF
jgi:hypothetical protein